jgi:hypothetical protein
VGVGEDFSGLDAVLPSGRAILGLDWWDPDTWLPVDSVQKDRRGLSNRWSLYSVGPS